MDCSNTLLINSDFIGDSSDSSSETVKIASCGSPTDCHGVPTERVSQRQRRSLR